MKKFLTFALVAVLLCAAFCTSAFAEETPAEEKVFWVTHFNDPYPEGAGVVFTEEYEHAGWWIHVVFEPVNVENTYKITNIVSGLADGSATPQAIPEGGFVWAANYGNDYITLGQGDTNFTNAACNTAITEALTWQVGQMFTFKGLDLDTLEVPTTTAGTNWYDASYVCTATYTAYTGEVPDAPATPDDSKDDSSTVTESKGDESVKNDESKAPVSAEDSSAAEDAEDGIPTWVIVLIVIAVVAVVAVVVVFVVKKK